MLQADAQAVALSKAIKARILSNVLREKLHEFVVLPVAGRPYSIRIRVTPVTTLGSLGFPYRDIVVQVEGTAFSQRIEVVFDAENPSGLGRMDAASEWTNLDDLLKQLSRNIIAFRP